jgi:hypothetical protein
MLVLDRHTIGFVVNGIIMNVRGKLFWFLTLIFRLLQNVHADRGCITRRDTSECAATSSAIGDEAESNFRRSGYVQGELFQSLRRISGFVRGLNGAAGVANFHSRGRGILGLHRVHIDGAPGSLLHNPFWKDNLTRCFGLLEFPTVHSAAPWWHQPYCLREKLLLLNGALAGAGESNGMP